MIERNIQKHLKKVLSKYPVLSLTGPRQSGKTTLLKSLFNDYAYHNLERPDTRELIMTDPVGLLKNPQKGVVLDEIQNVPELFSYIQAFSDENKINGQYILSGSQSFLLNNAISQSLAGRTSINKLFPFDTSELSGYIDELSTQELILQGFYPRIYDQQIDPDDYYPDYVQTYVERDIRTLKQIGDLNLFNRFLSLCAGRAGQILNYSSLANDTGISINTAKSWISLLETSYVIFLLQPWYKNINKRIIKSPKLYFYDTGLLSSLLKIRDAHNLRTHYLYGSIFENFVITDFLKKSHHKGIKPNMYFWRESNGTEIDLLLEVNSAKTLAVEIKSAATFNKDFIKNLNHFPNKVENANIEKHLIFDGDTNGKIKDIYFSSWRKYPGV